MNIEPENIHKSNYYDIICHTPDIIIEEGAKMQKQKVIYFATKAEDSGSMVSVEELRQMAAGYVSLYGESCLNDPETPSFVRRMMGKRAETELSRAG